MFSPSDATRPRVPRVLLGAIVLGVAYVAAARLGLKLATVHGAVSPVWPASGVAIAGLVLLGRRFWPAVALGAFAANLPGASAWWTALVIAVGNTGEALVGAWLIDKLRHGRESQALIWEAAGCTVASVVAPLVSALVGLAALAASGSMAGRGGEELLRTWWTGDALGVLALAPVLLAAARAQRTWRRSWPRLVQAVAVGALVAGVIFFLRPAGMLLFALFPALLLSTHLGGEFGAKLSAVVIAAIGIAAGVVGQGPFLAGSLNDNLLLLQLFLASIAVASLALPIFAASSALLVPGVFLAIGWSVSGWVFARIHRERLEADQMRLEAMAADVERATRQRMATYLEALRAASGLYAASENITSNEWRAFVGALHLGDRLPGIHGLGVAWRVPPGSLDAFVQARRSDGVPGYAVQVVPGGAHAPGQDRYLIACVEPIELNRDRLGLDLGSETRRRQAADEARDSGEPRASGAVKILTVRGGQPGFIVFHPIYRRGPEPVSVASRRTAIQGWIFAAFVAQEFFGNVFISPELEMSVFDGRSISEEARLFASHPEGTRRGGFEKVATIELAGNLVTLAWKRSDRWVAASPAASVLIASSLALVTLLLAGLGVSLQSIGRQAREIAAARTAELSAAQATLAGVNRLQRAVLDGTTYSIIATELDGTIRIFNRGAEQMLGYRREELIGRQTPSLIHLAAEVETRAAELSAELGRPIKPGFEVFVARAAQGEVEQREWTYVRRNGSHVPVLLSVSALRDDSGTITGYLGIAHDLTERRALEQSLRIEQSRLRLANEAAGIAVWEWDVEAGVVTWDAAMFALYGIAPTVGGRVSYDDWRHCVHPDDLLAQEDVLRAVVREAGRSQREFRIIRHADDEVRYVSASDLAIAGPDGRTVRIVGVNRDITDRRRALEQVRQSQARLATIFGAVREGLMLLDAGGRIVECNAATCRILGMTPAQLEGAKATPAVLKAVRRDGSEYPDDDYPAAVTLRTGVPVRDAIMGLPRGDGSTLWISMDTAAIHDPAGGVQAVVVSINDVSAQQQIARDLARARDEALETSRLKSEFLATMSHEIRTPMNGIIGTVDLLRGTPLDPTQDEMARLIQGSAENLLEIINDILDFSRIEAGKFRINPEPFELLPLLEETVALLAVRAQRKGLELVLDADPGLASEVFVGDPGRIRQVLLNIIGNAVKFTDRGEVVVTVSVRPSGAGAGRLRVLVRDTGIGIAPEFRGRLFSAFTQVDSSATRRFGGTGLGLAISRQLVELMGGQLDFASEPGRGSQFWVELDLPRQPGTVSQARQADVDVLVVDDNASARDSLVRQLRGLGCRVESVDSAAAALDHLTRGTAGGGRRRVVLVDRVMPGLDGIGLVRRAREIAALDDVAFVLLTTSDGTPAMHDLQAMGCSAVVAKPVRLGHLRVALEQARHGAATGAAVADPRASANGAATHDGPSLSVLVAEDNPTNQLVARMVLESLGHRVDVADNGRIALERLAEARYDVVFMDCQMPEIDGYEATRRLRAGTLPGVDPGQRVVALTAFAMESDRAKCREAGMDDYVSKPVRAAEARAVLERLGLVRRGAPHGAAPASVDAPRDARETAPASDAPAGGQAAAALPPEIAAEALVDESFQDGLRELPGPHGASLLVEVIALYARETAARLIDLHGMLAAGDLEALARTAHTLAGSSANAGAPRARAAFAAIESAVRSGADDDVAPRIATARQVWHELCADLVRRGLLSP